MGVNSTPEMLCEKHFRQWTHSNKFMLQVKQHWHKSFKLQTVLLHYLHDFHNIFSKTKLKYPQLVSNTRSGRGMRCDEAPRLQVRAQQGCRPTMPDAPSQGLMKWNKMDEMSVDQNKIILLYSIGRVYTFFFFTFNLGGC